MSASQGELYKLEKTKFFEIAAHHLTFLGMQSLCWLACVALSTGTCHRSVARCTFCYRSGGGGGAGQPSNSRFDQETAQDEASAVWPDGYQCHLLSLVGTTRLESFVCKNRQEPFWQHPGGRSDRSGHNTSCICWRSCCNFSWLTGFGFTFKVAQQAAIGSGMLSNHMVCTETARQSAWSSRDALQAHGRGALLILLRLTLRASF